MVRVEALTKEFYLDGETIRVLKAIDLEVAAGERLAICGESGAGKSTLLQIMGTLDKPTGGRVLHGGQDVFRWSVDRLAAWRNAHIGFVFQFHHLLPEFTALENVMIPAMIQGAGRKSAGERARRILERVGLENRLRHKPGELSGGEQQRVALARALVLNPPLILADEPTGNLDLKNSLEVENLLLEFNREFDLALVIVTHSQRLAQRMDKIIYLEDGSVRKVCPQ
ncbi:MAG: ABC transporter ATP-binding protein [Deltaproteobacteria bacterium]|nr:ABC transporter ATP-binding protein [Deltaproteobacteria bacterium]